MADNKFFTNTYITGSGRQNYLRIDNLEDPLFTSFTFDIDFNTSPLFYTINNSYFDTANAKEHLSDKIETALSGMREKYMGKDQGYDILPVFSGSMIDDDKLGFGLQQNVYMDLPLYGATEYIYMVDKRNANGIQNDVRYNNSNNQQIYNESTDNYEYSNNNNDSYKLGDSVKGIVNGSDKRWAEEKIKQNVNVIAASEETIGPSGYDSDGNPIETDASKRHNELKQKMDAALEECNKVTASVTINGEKKECTEAELLAEYNRLQEEIDKYEVLKQDIVNWANEEISKYQSKIVNAYNNNKCLQDAIEYGLETKESKNNKDAENKAKKLAGLHGDKFRDHLINFVRGIETIYEEVISYSKDMKKSGAAWGWVDDQIETDAFLRNNKQGDQQFTINLEHVLKKFDKRLEELKIDKNLVGNIKVGMGKAYPDWVESLNKIGWFIGSFDNNGDSDEKYRYVMHQILKELMSLECNIDTAFNDFDQVGGDFFMSNEYKKIKEQFDKIDNALYEVRYELYGTMDGIPEHGGNNYSIYNPDPDSAYGKYKALEEEYQNDEYSQAEKAKSIAESENKELQDSLTEYGNIPSKKNEDKSVQTDIEHIEENSNTIIAPQTVIDIVEFISGMKKMIQKYPYIIQGITGLDTAYNKHYIVKDPYLGSGEDKITLTCLESLNLRVSSMFNRYFNAVYDRQYRRERVPVNLRRFNCSVYVHDVRNFVNNIRQTPTDNRILELTDMYYSVIEFKFYDCEIVPEETGNIFNDISNESPSEMKKTNFTFTYGNCVVNFIPNWRVTQYK